MSTDTIALAPETELTPELLDRIGKLPLHDRRKLLWHLQESEGEKQYTESELQDEKIMNYQRKLSAGKTNQEEELQSKILLQNCQRLLKTISVRNPFAEYLSLPQSVFKPRRTNAHYLQFIEVITFYKQYQKEHKIDKESGEEYIVNNAHWFFVV